MTHQQLADAHHRAVEGIALLGLEVFVDCPLEACMARDPKGVYRRAREGRAATVAGLQTEYERPERPEIVIRGDRETPPAAARRVLDALRAAGLMEE